MPHYHIYAVNKEGKQVSRWKIIAKSVEQAKRIEAQLKPHWPEHTIKREPLLSDNQSIPKL